jgi:hypothetical protein
LRYSSRAIKLSFIGSIFASLFEVLPFSCSPYPVVKI